MVAPTSEAYAELQAAFNHFNRTLFDGALSPCMITLQREKRTYGYHSNKRFISQSTTEMIDEIALNPEYFAVRPVRWTLSTLAHEMVHQWQDAYGTPGRGRYHNKEWAFKMKAIGLYPSTTGAPGGKETGDQMTHYIVEGGPFDLACSQLLTDQYRITWLDRHHAPRPRVERTYKLSEAKSGEPDGAEGADEVAGTAYDDNEELVRMAGLVVDQEEGPTNRSNRAKFTCPVCKQSAWGKPSLVILCGISECRQMPMLLDRD